ILVSDSPRGVANRLWLWWFPAAHPLPVAPALAVPFLFTRRRLAVSLLRLPPRPFSRRLPAALAAIALARLPGMKALRAPFQQQRRVRGRRAICRRPPAGFSTGLVGFSGGPMGGDDSQKLLPWRGIHSSPGRKPPAQLRINNVTETAGWNLALPPPSLAGLAVASATGRLGHFWKAHSGQFWRAPKYSLAETAARARQ